MPPKKKATPRASSKSQTKMQAKPFGVDVRTDDVLTVIHLISSHDANVAGEALATAREHCGADAQLLESFLASGLWPQLDFILNTAQEAHYETALAFLHLGLTAAQTDFILLDEARALFGKIARILIENGQARVLASGFNCLVDLLRKFPEIVDYVYDPALVSRIFCLLQDNNDSQTFECIEATLNLLADLITSAERLEEACDLTQFTTQPLVCLMTEGGEDARRAAFKLFAKLCAFRNDTFMRSCYGAHVPHKLVELLSKDEYLDFRFDIIYLLTFLFDAEALCAQFVNEEEFPQLLSFSVAYADEFELRYVQLLKIFAKFSEPSYRQTLHDYGFETAILSILYRTNDADVQKELCWIIMNLANHFYGVGSIAKDEQFVPALIKLLEQQATVAAAVEVTHCMLKRSADFPGLFVEPPNNGMSAIMNIFLSVGGEDGEQAEVTANAEGALDAEIFQLVMDIVSYYMKHPNYKDDYVSLDNFQKLLWIYRHKDGEAALLANNIMNDQITDRSVREWFVDLQVQKYLIDTLKTTKDDSLFKYTLIFIKNLVVYKKIAKCFLHAGLIPVLNEFQNDNYCARALIHTLCALFLPLKFYTFDRLDVTDGIVDNFYLIRGRWNGCASYDVPFPLLEELQLLKMSTKVTIYVVDYSYTKRKRQQEREAKLQDGEPRRASMSKEAVKDQARKSSGVDGRAKSDVVGAGSDKKVRSPSLANDSSRSRGKFDAKSEVVSDASKLTARSKDEKRGSLKVIDEAEDEWASNDGSRKLSTSSLCSAPESVPMEEHVRVLPEINYGYLSEDPYIYDYFVELERTFKRAEPCLSLYNRIFIIAKFVDEQLKGFMGYENDVPEHTFQLHLNALKARLGTNMIPVGFLRMGFSCERALLFKVLADNFNIFTTLRRSGDAYWNELPLTFKSEDKPEEIDPYRQFIVYYVVDLMENIGGLYALGSFEAGEYMNIITNHSSVNVPTPDYTGRKEILGLYLGKIMAKEIDVELLARGTTGFTGADLESMVNQAALRAAIDGCNSVSMKYLESARDKVLMGPERKSRIPDEEANTITAYHEGGHAIVAFYTKDSHPLHKVTIIPRGPSLGHTAYIPEKERYHVTKSQLLAMMDTMMGGRAAEELVFGPDKITSGASSDLKQATSIATHMVKDWGMSERVGLRTVQEGNKPFTGEMLGPSTNELIDAEIKKIMSESYERAKIILKTHAKEHKALAEALMKYETLDADDIKAIMSDKTPNIELK